MTDTPVTSEPASEPISNDERRIAQIHKERAFLGHPWGTGSLSLLNLGMGVGHGTINAILIYYMYAKAPGA